MATKYINILNTLSKDWSFYSIGDRDGEQEVVIEDLKKSGLTLEILQRAKVQLFRGTPEELYQKLGYTTFNNQELLNTSHLLEFPYFNQEGEIVLYRYKLYPPLDENGKKDVKYLHPKGKPPLPYILPEVYKVKDNPNIPIWITEGEKKALKLIQSREYAIALSGVWCFKAGKDSIFTDQLDLWEDLKSFTWKGRIVYLAFDMDLWSNENVAMALWELGIKLWALGANVRIAQWDIQDGKGIDDYLSSMEKKLYHRLKVSQKGVETTSNKVATKKKSIVSLSHQIYIQNIPLCYKTIEEFSSREHLEAITRALSIVELPEQLATDLKKKIANNTGISIRELEKDISRRREENINKLYYTLEEKEKALELLKDKQFIEKFLELCHKEYIGRDEVLILVKLATVARLTDKGIPVILTGTSSVGKSALLETVLKTVNPEVVVDYSQTSEKYLLYLDKPLDHKILYIKEMRGALDTAYSISTAISEGVLILGTVDKTGSRGLGAKRIRKSTKGLVFLTTTTKRIYPDLATRVLAVEISYDEKLAEAIYRLKANPCEGLEEEFKLFQIADKLLQSYDVYIPYTEELIKAFPKGEERYNRDWDKVLSLIKASAILHQYQREKDEQGRLIATEDDYMLAYSLRDIISQSISPVSTPIIEFLKKAQELGNNVTMEKLKEATGKSKATIYRYIKEARTKGLIEVMGSGKELKIAVLEIPEMVNPLPSPEKVFNGRTQECFLNSITTIPSSQFFINNSSETMRQQPTTSSTPSLEMSQGGLRQNETMIQNSIDDGDGKSGKSIAQRKAEWSDFIKGDEPLDIKRQKTIAMFRRIFPDGQELPKSSNIRKGADG